MCILIWWKAQYHIAVPLELAESFITIVSAYGGSDRHFCTGSVRLSDKALLYEEGSSTIPLRANYTLAVHETRSRPAADSIVSHRKEAWVRSPLKQDSERLSGL